MRLLAFALTLGLFTALPVLAAPTLHPEPVSLAHPELKLETIVLDDWRLQVSIPEGWSVEDSGELLRFVGPERLANCGIEFTPEESITKDAFFDTVWEQLAAEPGMDPVRAGIAKVGPLGVPLIWATVEMEGVAPPQAADEDSQSEPAAEPVPAKFQQIIAYYEFSPDEFPYIATASAPEALWSAAAPELEAILGHVVPLLSEDEAFAAMEQGQ